MPHGVACIVRDTFIISSVYHSLSLTGAQGLPCRVVLSVFAIAGAIVLWGVKLIEQGAQPQSTAQCEQRISLLFITIAVFFVT